MPFNIIDSSLGGTHVVLTGKMAPPKLTLGKVYFVQHERLRKVLAENWKPETIIPDVR